MVRELYVREMDISDQEVRDAYKTVYAFHSGILDEDTLVNELTRILLEQYQSFSPEWGKYLDTKLIGQIYLRLIISIKSMSGGVMGNKGYLNYLKNNLDPSLEKNQLIVEDRFGNKMKGKTA